VGSRVREDDGPVWRAVRTGEVQVTQRAYRGRPPGASRMFAPLALSDRVMGAIVLDRAAGAAAFDEADRLVAALFAEHAARAVSAAVRLDHARERTGVLEREVTDLRELVATSLDEQLEDPADEAVDVAALAREVVETGGTTLADAGRVVVVAHGPAVVRGDRRLLRRMLVDLLACTAGAAPAGATTELVVATGPEGTRLRVGAVLDVDRPTRSGRLLMAEVELPR
jgi:signal transduction histidine kinase